MGIIMLFICLVGLVIGALIAFIGFTGPFVWMRRIVQAILFLAFGDIAYTQSGYGQNGLLIHALAVIIGIVAFYIIRFRRTIATPVVQPDEVGPFTHAHMGERRRPRRTPVRSVLSINYQPRLPSRWMRRIEMWR